ncbi:MAG: M20 family metallopeptidase [Meiothermus sp.]|uniref:M20 family metallopeptidase n=1 Tax=Meiothermus sp. TaxID=1955249 RepID=UPI0025E6F9E8|nr:M20 family metallopeptidase [Meiothermus sp.]MCS7057777.1 M20 family metallopeptidase [Meiothermus sp.]MCS7194620.1 M20 family metallopeptidase [Meiothermus sp.]MCX7740809.1 M20 family metallopeptidase [Meiothermus sp.]MDW8090971.1 M20 family metallopeptidase [Meiothermus sp.]MDW8481865.1 M20 family metallopeptidase [Meiothermus sp.]
MRPLDYLQSRLSAILADLEAIVVRESPSHHQAGLEEVAHWIDQQFRPFGAVTQTQTPNGPLLRVEVAGRGKRVLVLCHYDTVHPIGSFQPLWRVEGERAYGPGVYDMKGGIVQLLWALRASRELGLGWPQLELLFTPDEEVGSHASRAAIEEAALRSDAVLVLEPPTGNGDLKVARKGVGQYRLTAQGKAAHQGVEPEKGINAIVELAHQIPRVVALEDPERGTTLGPNVVRGGTASNVVAAEAWVEVDLRVWTRAEAERVEAALRALRPALPGASLRLEGGLNRPPMEPTEASMSLFEMARRIGEALGLHLGPGRVGGGSDGNFTAALGIPTLDGLGLFGEAAHQPTENVHIPQIPLRTALLCGVLEEMAR